MTTDIITADHPNTTAEVWPFTRLDITCIPMVITGTWIFSPTLDVDGLKSGLKTLLQDYPHLSGRLNGNKGIQLTNKGVPFSEENHKELSLADKYQPGDSVEQFSSKISIAKLKRGLDSPMMVKVTCFRDASILSVSCSHACMDGDSYYKMMRNWGLICRHEGYESPVLEQSLFPVAEDADKKVLMQQALANGWVKVSSFQFLFRVVPVFISGQLKKRVRAFYFSADDQDALREDISKKLGFRISKHVALSAFVCKACIKLLHHTDTTECMQLNVMNARGHLKGIPQDFVGNASTMARTRAFTAGTSIEDIAGIIHESLIPMLETPSEKTGEFIKLSMSAIAAKLPLAPFDIIRMYAKSPAIFHINNFSKLPVYDVDFGSGRPLSVIPHNLSDQILIWPATEKGGVEVYFSGPLAKKLKALKPTDPWLQEMKSYTVL